MYSVKYCIQLRTPCLRIYDILQWLQYVQCSNTMRQVWMYSVIQFVLYNQLCISLELTSSRSRPKLNRLIHCQKYFRLFFITHSKFPSALKHIQHCSKYCCFADFPLYLESYSMQTGWMLFHCNTCIKCLLKLHQHDQDRRPVAASIG